MITEEDIAYMRLALEEAGFAFSEGEVPVGAVLIIRSTIVARAHNQRERLSNPAAHAEMIVLQESARSIQQWRLTDATLYVTKEPCVMCAGAIVNARLGRLVYGCRDTKGGAVDSLYHIPTDERLNHRVEVVSGVLEEESALLLQRFFQERR